MLPVELCNQRTTQEMKKAMPFDVNVLFPDKTKAVGKVRGRQNEFPIVSIPVHGTELEMEITWELAKKAWTKNSYIRA